MQLTQTVRRISVKMHTQRPTPTIEQDLKIAASLCGLDHAEGILLSRHRQIDLVIECDLQKDAVVPASFVRLSGRMQKAWAKAETCCGASFLEHNFADRLQDALVCVIHLDI